MKAIVRKIKANSRVVTKGHSDIFAAPMMVSMIGKTITIKPYVVDRKVIRGWFESTGRFSFLWHRSWLKFVE